MIAAARSEWIKLTTVATSWVLTVVAVAFPIVITLLTAALTNSALDGEDLANVLAGTAIVSAMLLGVLAVVGVTSEFSHHTIRPTFAAMPDRRRPLLAKLLVHLAVTVMAIVAIIVVAWALGVAIADGPQSLGDGEARATLVGLVLLAIALTILGDALGLLVRNAALAISILLLWPFVVESLIAGLLTKVGADGAQKLLPYVNGLQMVIGEDDSNLLGRAEGGAYFFAWVLALAVLGLVVAQRRDA